MDIIVFAAVVPKERRQLSQYNTVIAYGLDDHVPVPDKGKYLSPCHHIPDRYRGCFSGGLCGLGMKLATHLQPVPRLKFKEINLSSTTRLHGIVLD
jgi:hypothetical protein